jgi:uncharacterized membrane protein
MDNPILFAVVPVLKALLELVAAVCVLAGLVRTIYLGWCNRAQLNDPDVISQLRVSFGSWLVLALEFQLGSDILSTTIAPSFEELAQLAIIAGIRTLLNYFLQKDLDAVRAARQARDVDALGPTAAAESTAAPVE